MTNDANIGIIGGGIAGLASAIGLAKTGRQIRLFERAAKFEEVGAGLQVGPNAVSALKALGVFERIEPTTVAPANIRVMDGLTGRCLNHLPLGRQFENRFGQPYRVIHRADLLTGLLAGAKDLANVELNTSKTLQQLEIGLDKNIATFADGTSAEFSSLIGADGFRSQVRRQVLNDGPPIFAGHTLFRTLLPIDEWPDLPNLEDVHLWLYPAGHVVHYPVSAGKNLNIVAAIEENWPQRGWSTPADRSDVTVQFPRANARLSRLVAAPQSWLKWAAAGHPFSAIWHKHNAIMIGDAIHPTLPYLAQGAAMALEDAVTLAANITQDRPISDFVSARQQRTAKIVATSSKLAKIYHMKNPARLARNLVISQLSPRQQYDRLAWIYDWQAPTL